MNFDVFISHASEDKDDFVRELAEKLNLRRIEVWYDEHSLKIGDSLRQSIDLGLSKSRFGIVVLSKDFFNKDWTNWELDGLVQRQLNSKNNLILPIWHNIDKEDILAYSPSLADKVAIKSNIGIEKIVDRIEKIINPKGSTLIVAREYLISKGYNPPIISNDWWLDVLEYPGDTVLQNDYLKFSIPWFGLEPSNRGKYIGQNALQMLWRENAIAENISQLSSPKEIIDFINSQAGLQEICLEQPLKTALFFPQLTIKGMGGFMETKFDELYSQKSSNREYTCLEEVALRDKDIGNYGATTIASFYFSGDGGGIGPSTRLYDLIDCLIWLLSSKSDWLPNSIRNILFNGLCNWSAWDWTNISYEGYDKDENTGEFFHFLYDSLDNPKLNISDGAKKDIYTRIQVAIEVLYLPESKEQLADKFLSSGAIESWVKSNDKRRNRAAANNVYKT